jgi:hypothetical protein
MNTEQKTITPDDISGWSAMQPKLMSFLDYQPLGYRVTRNVLERIAIKETN